MKTPQGKHKKLKSRAAILGKSMREIILVPLVVTDICLQSNHYPNKKTQQSFKNIEESKNVTKIDLNELSQKLGMYNVNG